MKLSETLNMRALLAAAASGLALFAAGAASAQSDQYASDLYASDRYANVTVAIGPELAGKADRIGMREIDLLREDLARNVGRALERGGGQRADLVLEMATPNRPTFEQLGRRPGLSMWSIGVGGASVTGTVTRADGTVEPVSYRWYEQDIRNARGSTTWSDANRAFNMLSHRIARGTIPDQGPHRTGHREDGLFGTYRY
jgi:hypothetical protein